MTEFFRDAWGNVGKTQCKCQACVGSDSSRSKFGSGKGPYNETCFRCAGYGWVCEEEEFTPDDRDELDKWVFED